MHRPPLRLLAALALTACKGSETINTQVETAKAETASIMEAAKEMQQADVNVKLNAWFEDKFMERARRYPQRLAGLGIKERMDESSSITLRRMS